MPNPNQPTLNNLASLYDKVGHIFPDLDDSKSTDVVYVTEYMEETIKKFAKYPAELYYFISTVMEISEKVLLELSGKDLYELFVDAITKSQILIFKQFVESI